MTDKSITELIAPLMTSEQFELWVDSYDGVSHIPENVQEYAFAQLNKMLAKLRNTNEGLRRML